MNQKKFEQFSKEYEIALEEACRKYPDEYFTQGASPAQFALTVSRKMMGNIAAGKHMENNYNSRGFKGACKNVGIKHTRKAIFEFLEIK